MEGPANLQFAFKNPPRPSMKTNKNYKSLKKQSLPIFECH